jgi:S1-C subfamily serine protease
VVPADQGLPRSRKTPALSGLAGWMLLGSAICVIATSLSPESARAQIHAQPRTAEPRVPLAPYEQTTIEIFERTSPSVVYITTVQHVRDYWTRNVMRVPRGTGSGFVWDAHGHIVTNYHVIRNAQEALVTLADQRRFSASLIGASPDHDLAVLAIDVPDTMPPAVPIGTSGDLRVGQSVLAIGNPFGLDYTLTTGVISALNRSIDNDLGGVIENLIQTDAAINPGNSGGPLIDSAGRLIGINTAIFSPSGAYAGIGFAVPVDIVNRVVPTLINYGRYARPTLGISANDEVSRRLLGPLGIDGVLLLQVAPGSLAEHAGLRGTQVASNGDVLLGDAIQALNGVPVTNLASLTGLLDQHAFGETVWLEIWRNSERLTLSVQLVE